MLNFAVGPVMMGQSILDISSKQLPYFRTEQFSLIMKENERLFCECLNSPENSRAVFLTGSGTSSMEAAVINTLTVHDKVLIVNGGSFGARFCEICVAHSIPFSEIRCEQGETLISEQLSVYDGCGYTAFLINLCETSTGVLYDIDLISKFCQRNGLLLIVDAVSAFLCDNIDMTLNKIDVLITGSQKALALSPGLSLICLNPKAIERVVSNKISSYYFDLKKYLKDGERGQTPFTPAVGVLLQLNQRLREISNSGGARAEIDRVKQKADYFRNAIKDLPLNLFSKSQSNAVTALVLKDEKKSAYKLFELLMKEYDIWVCPNGGSLRDKVFRVGHMGTLGKKDYDTLVNALNEALYSEKLNND